MLHTFNKAFWYELKSIRQNWYKLFLVTLLPLFVFWLIISIFQHGVLREVPIVVVNNDHSQLSTKLLQNIESSATIKIAFISTSIKEAMQYLKSSKAYGLVVIPPHFEENILLQKKPQVTAMLNTQYILIGKILTSSLNKSVSQSAAEVEFIQHLAKKQDIYTALSSIAPISIQTTPFFNTYQNYYYFLVSALIPSVWQIFIVMTTLVSLGTLFKYKQTAEIFEKNKHISSTLLGLMLPYTIIFTCMGIGFLWYIFKQWEFQGSFLIVLFGIFLTTVAYQIIALFLFTTGFDYARSLSLGAVYTAPAFAFLGVTFPIYNMNSFALFWRDILPISHYIQLQISQANYGINVWNDLEKIKINYSY